MATMTTKTKVKAKAHINKTNRVRIALNNSITTIYCSTEIVREVRHLCVRLNNFLVPKKGHNNDLVHLLADLTETHPDHFPATGKQILLEATS